MVVRIERPDVIIAKVQHGKYKSYSRQILRIDAMLFQLPDTSQEFRELEQLQRVLVLERRECRTTENPDIFDDKF